MTIHPSGVEPAVRTELAAIARQLRQLETRDWRLELMAHDIARLFEVVGADRSPRRWPELYLALPAGEALDGRRAGAGRAPDLPALGTRPR